MIASERGKPILGEVDMTKFYEWVKENAAALTVLVFVVTGLVAAAYTVGLKQGENYLVTAKEFNKHLPDMMDELKKLATDLRQSVEVADENARLKAEVAKNSGEVAELNNAIQKQKAALDAKDKHLAELEPVMAKFFPTESVTATVEEHSAPEVIPNVLRIGVDSVSDYNGYATVIVNGERLPTLGINDPKDVQVGDRTCTVTVEKIAKPAVQFAAYCVKKAK